MGDRDASQTMLRLYEVAGPDGYPAEWHATIKHQVRHDAGYRCVRCHHPYAKGDGEWSSCDERCDHVGPIRYRFGNEAWCDFGYVAWAGMAELRNRAEAAETAFEAQAQWRILTVHHLDGDKLNCRWWNLVALCQRCHLTIQQKVKMERRWLREHTDWFKPYVAGYYAFTLLGEDLSRQEVEARLEELLALEERQLELGVST